MNKYKVPRWIEEGPMDLEYKTFKMLASVKALELKLAEGLLMDCLWEIDDTLDYLYRYDAQLDEYRDEVVLKKLYATYRELAK
jgi:hypothetical protein